MALDHLSEGMQKFLNEQMVINTSGKGKVVASRSDVMKHSSSGKEADELRAIHPVVRTHPETKEKALFTVLKSELRGEYSSSRISV